MIGYFFLKVYNRMIYSLEKKVYLISTKKFLLGKPRMTETFFSAFHPTARDNLPAMLANKIIRVDNDSMQFIRVNKV
jgi:hypothetical protein